MRSNTRRFLSFLRNNGAFDEEKGHRFSTMSFFLFRLRKSPGIIIVLEVYTAGKRAGVGFYAPFAIAVFEAAAPFGSRGVGIALIDHATAYRITILFEQGEFAFRGIESRNDEAGASREIGKVMLAFFVGRNFMVLPIPTRVIEGLEEHIAAVRHSSFEHAPKAPTSVAFHFASDLAFDLGILGIFDSTG